MAALGIDFCYCEDKEYKEGLHYGVKQDWSDISKAFEKLNPEA